MQNPGEDIQNKEKSGRLENLNPLGGIIKAELHFRVVSACLRKVPGVRLCQGLLVELFQNDSAFLSRGLTAALRTHVCAPTARRHYVSLCLEYKVYLIKILISASGILSEFPLWSLPSQGNVRVGREKDSRA